MLKGQRVAHKRIENLIVEANDFYLNLLGYCPEETSLVIVQEHEWRKVIQRRGLNPNSSGVYLPRDQKAIVKTENPLGLFHEYYGHGLYCEKSLEGRELVDLERKLYLEEKEIFEGKSFTLQELKEFREQSNTYKKLRSFIQKNLRKYEMFAIWTEYILSKEQGMYELFYRRFNLLSTEEQRDVESLINFSESRGYLETFKLHNFDSYSNIENDEELKGGKGK